MVMELVEQLSGSKHKLEGLSFGGGPASVRLPETVEKFLGGNVPAGQGYGLTGECRKIGGESEEANSHSLIRARRNEFRRNKFYRSRLRLTYVPPSHPLPIPLIPSHTLTPSSFAGPTSCGLPAPVVDITIRDPSTGIILPPKTPGEICVKGPNVALGYWENEQATKEAFSEDGWFRS